MFLARNNLKEAFTYQFSETTSVEFIAGEFVELDREQASVISANLDSSIITVMSVDEKKKLDKMSAKRDQFVKAKEAAMLKKKELAAEKKRAAKSVRTTRKLVPQTGNGRERSE